MKIIELLCLKYIYLTKIYYQITKSNFKIEDVSLFSKASLTKLKKVSSGYWRKYRVRATRCNLSLQPLLCKGYRN